MRSTQAYDVGVRGGAPRPAAAASALLDAGDPIASGGDDGGPGMVVAVLENRAREVGVCALDLNRGRLYLHQLIETTHMYENTNALLSQHAPSTILLCNNR